MERYSNGLRHPNSGKPETATAPNGREVPTFSVSNISYRYERNLPLIEPMDFTIPLGCITAITGGNGTGKTTLGKTLCGLLRQKRGKIQYRGKTLSAGGRCRRSYFVMQDADYQLYSESVGNELILGRKVTEALRARAYDAMELFGLTKYKDRHPASLSGGEKQRVTLAAAYCSNADLIILDEPTSGLDVINAKRVAQFKIFVLEYLKTAGPVAPAVSVLCKVILYA